jgi:hypothetical protein
MSWFRKRTQPDDAIAPIVCGAVQAVERVAPVAPVAER